MTKQTNNEISISIPSETEKVSGKTKDIPKTDGKPTTIIRDTKRRTLEGTVGGCLHGSFKDHVSSRSLGECKQLLWITVIVCMICLTLYQASNVAQYLGHQEVIVHSEIRKQKSVPFPAVTICSQEPFHKNKIKYYYTRLTSTTSMKTTKDFDAIWAIYYLEEALKLHGKQPSCKDSLLKVTCSLNPTQSCEGQEDSLYPWNSNLRKLQRQRSLENNVIPDIDNIIPNIDNVIPYIDNVFPDIDNVILDNDNVMTSPCSDFVWNSWLPGMINSGEESDIMKLALINECLFRYNEDRYAMSVSSKYYETHSLWSTSYSRNSDQSNSFNLWSDDFWKWPYDMSNEDYILYSSWNWWYIWSTNGYSSNSGVGGINLWPADYSSHDYSWDWWHIWSTDGYRSNSGVGGINPWPADYSSHDYSWDWSVGSFVIDDYSDFSYWSDNDSLLPLPGLRFWSVISGLANNVGSWLFGSSSSSGSTGIMNSIWNAASSVVGAAFDFVDENFRTEYSQGILNSIFSVASVIAGTVFNWDKDDTAHSLGEDTLQRLYEYYPQYTRNDILTLMGLSTVATFDQIPVGEANLQQLSYYFPDYTYEQLIYIWQAYGMSVQSTDLYHSNSHLYSSFLPVTYPIPDSSFSDISFNRPFFSYRSTPSSLDSFSELLSEMNEQGYFNQTKFSPLGKEMIMLNTFLSKSVPVDPKDLMQWSSINKKLIEQLGFTYSEMISECSYNGEACDIRDFIVWKNDRYGNCFTFNSECNAKTKAREADKPGKQNGLKLVLNTVEEGHRGFRLLIHHPTEVPIPEENGIDISTEEISILPTSMLLHERLQEPQGSCKDMNWALEGSQTLDGCRKMCYEEIIRRVCHCKKIMLPMKTDAEEQLPQCGFKNMKCLLDNENLYNEESCSHCLSPCHEVTYNTEVVRIKKQQANDRCTDYLQAKPNEFRNTTPSVIHVYMETLQIENLTEKMSYPLQDLITNTGVWLYALFGVSMLSLVEFILELVILLVSKTNNVTKDVYEEKTVTIKYQRGF